jgi:hypothetical protein
MTLQSQHILEEQDVGNVSLDDPCDVTRDTLPFTPGIFGCSR